MSAPVPSLQRSSAPAIPRLVSRPAKSFRILTFTEVEAQPEPKWLVDGVLPSNGLAMLYGPPGVGKTFLALDLALAVASGQSWLGRPTSAGDVLYVVAEGIAGFPKRLSAAASARQLDKSTVHVHFIAEPVQLHSGGEIDALTAAIGTIGAPLRLIVFDTLSRCFVGGEENSAKDIGKLIDGADRIRKQTGATVLLVHHTTKDQTSERGSSALRGAADVMLAVSATKAGVLLECKKQKDSAPFAPTRLRLVPTGGSCAIELTEATSKADSGTVSASALAALRVLSQTNGLRCKDWLTASATSGGTFYRHLDELNKAHLVTKEGVIYVLTDKGRAVLAPALTPK